MSKKNEFIEFVENQIMSQNLDVPEGAKIFWEAFKNSSENTKEKPLLTENGKMILSFLQSNQDTSTWKAREIAEGLFVSSRTVSGSIRKLVTDGFVEQISKDPSIYSITEKGKNLDINNI